MTGLADHIRKAGLAGSEAPPRGPAWTNEVRSQDIGVSYCGYTVHLDQVNHVVHQCTERPHHDNNHVCNHGFIAW